MLKNPIIRSSSHTTRWRMCLSVMSCMQVSVVSSRPTQYTGRLISSSTAVACEDLPCKMTLRA